MDNTSNDSEPLIPADAPDDYIVGYEVDGTPIILKDFLEQADEAIDKCDRGYYYKHEDLGTKYDAYFEYLKKNPESKLSPGDFEKRFPEYSPTLYHGPRAFQLTDVQHYLDTSIADASQHINIFKILEEDVKLKSLFATDLLDGRYTLETEEEIMSAMNTKGKNDEKPLPRMSFLWGRIAENKFQSLTKSSLEKTLRDYTEQSDWGVDLPFFVESVERTVEILNEASETATVLYINKDDAQEGDLIEYDWHGYAIIIVIFDAENKKLTTIDLGGE